LKIEDTGKIARLAGDSIFEEIRRIATDIGNVKRLHRLNRVFPLLKKFVLEPNFYKSQNLYFEISTEKKNTPETILPEWQEQFVLLGFNLGVKVEA
jgi:hypothetical protein